VNTGKRKTYYQIEIKNFTITKRDGSKDSFSLDKIMHAIVKAFESVNEPSDLASISLYLLLSSFISIYLPLSP